MIRNEGCRAERGGGGRQLPSSPSSSSSCPFSLLLERARILTPLCFLCDSTIQHNAARKQRNLFPWAGSFPRPGHSNPFYRSRYNSPGGLRSTPDFLMARLGKHVAGRRVREKKEGRPRSLYITQCDGQEKTSALLQCQFVVKFIEWNPIDWRPRPKRAVSSFYICCDFFGLWRHHYCLHLQAKKNSEFPFLRKFGKCDYLC